MQTFNTESKAKISAQIADVERQCDSELVCLITPRSARYIGFPILIAALIALALPLIQIITEMISGTAIAITFAHQTLVFVSLAALFVVTPLRVWITPQWLRHQNCARYSTEQFFAHRLHETTARNAILIFVSWDEKFVTVIADKGINAKVDQDAWDALIAAFTTALKAREVETGFMHIIRGAGDLLVKHFPLHTAKTDELPNHLIELHGPDYVS